MLRVHYLTPAPRRRLRDLRAVRKAVRKAGGTELPDTCFSFLPRRLGLQGEVVREARTEATFTYKTSKIYHYFESLGEERGGGREVGRCRLCGEEGAPVKYYTFLSHMLVGELRGFSLMLFVFCYLLLAIFYLPFIVHLRKLPFLKTLSTLCIYSN